MGITCCWDRCVVCCVTVELCCRGIGPWWPGVAVGLLLYVGGVFNKARGLLLVLFAGNTVYNVGAVRVMSDWCAIVIL